jgi:hypothetical protein
MGAALAGSSGANAERASGALADGGDDAARLEDGCAATYGSEQV